MKKIIYVCLIILFSCSDKELEQIEQTLYENTPEEVDAIICRFETTPEFIGGTEALLKYIQENNHYKKGQLTVEGTVFISFMVTETGKVTDAQLTKGFYEICDEEALRIIQNMPDWKPAERSGVKIKSRMVIPVRFKM